MWQPALLACQENQPGAAVLTELSPILMNFPIPPSSEARRQKYTWKGRNPLSWRRRTAGVRRPLERQSASSLLEPTPRGWRLSSVRGDLVELEAPIPQSDLVELGRAWKNPFFKNTGIAAAWPLEWV